MDEQPKGQSLEQALEEAKDREEVKALLRSQREAACLQGIDRLLQQYRCRLSCIHEHGAQSTVTYRVVSQ